MRWCSGKGERLGYERSGFDPGLRSSFFLIETLSITGQKVSKCFRNDSDRLRKGNLRWSREGFLFCEGELLAATPPKNNSTRASYAGYPRIIIQ